jgi:benzoyl-CoA reductase/2-hydroxyglutaryl-CoA dehydratase subunit BcrC/BadD/HgdB
MQGEIKCLWTDSAEIFGFAAQIKIKRAQLDAVYLYTTDCGCTKISDETIALIEKMAKENQLWGVYVGSAWTIS